MVCVHAFCGKCSWILRTIMNGPSKQTEVIPLNAPKDIPTVMTPLRPAAPLCHCMNAVITRVVADAAVPKRPHCCMLLHRINLESLAWHTVAANFHQMLQDWWRPGPCQSGPRAVLPAGWPGWLTPVDAFNDVFVASFQLQAF